jgi:hypothetical protein
MGEDLPDEVRRLTWERPAPVVWVEAREAPSSASLLVAVAALRARGFEVAWEDSRG